MIKGRRSYRLDSPQSTPTGSPGVLRKPYRAESTSTSSSSSDEEEQIGAGDTPSTSRRQSQSAFAAIPDRCEETTPVKSTVIIFIITVGILFVYALLAGSEEIPTPHKTVKCSLESLAERHPEQEKCIWPRLSAGIVNVIHNRPSSPGVFLFVHQGGKQRLIKDVATKTASCFGQPLGPAEMSLQDFAVDSDYRNAIYKFKELAQHNHVVIVPTLNKIPAETAIALHTICDTYSPIVMDTVIFLSLEVPKNNVHPIENAEDELREIWGNVLKQYQLEPLITRITDQVVVLN